MLYTDPGSGALLWQILGASVVGAMFYVRKAFSYFSGRKKEPVNPSEVGGSEMSPK